MPRKSRSLEDVLCAGGECGDGAELTMLLETSLKVLRASSDRRLACELMATPARLQLPERLTRMQAYAALEVEADDGTTVSIVESLDAVVEAEAVVTPEIRPDIQPRRRAPAPRSELRAAPVAAAARRRR